MTLQREGEGEVVGGALGAGGVAGEGVETAVLTCALVRAQAGVYAVGRLGLAWDGALRSGLSVVVLMNLQGALLLS